MGRVLVTGGAGYLGTRLTERLLAYGYQVTILDNFMYNQLSLLHLCHDKALTIIRGDVSDTHLLSKLIFKNDVIIPLAAIVGAPACEANRALATRVNFDQIVFIVDHLSKDQELIMPNTNSQYGSSDNIITEESEFKPLSHYAQTKCDAEDYIIKNGNGVCLRLATVFGASSRMRTDLLVNNFVYRAMTDGFLVLYESHFKRNYIHIQDVVRTFMFCMDNYKDVNNDVFNVGLSYANLTKKELAEEIKRHIPGVEIIENDFAKDSDQRNYLVSNEKLMNKGWRPKYSLQDGIKELIKANEMVISYNNKSFTNL